MTGAQVSTLTADQLAELFHTAYERLAPMFGYDTREETRRPWREIPDAQKGLMRATCAEVLAALRAPALPEGEGGRASLAGADIRPPRFESGQAQQAPAYRDGAEPIAGSALQDEEIEDLLDAAERAWGVIANVSGGTWDFQGQDWQDAAAYWRDRYMPTVSRLAARRAAFSTQPEIDTTLKIDGDASQHGGRPMTMREVMEAEG